jgi:pantoate--beta-alanine ligase
MKVIKYIEQMQKEALDAHSARLKIGFVPTMGALHNGHLSLVKKARSENDICVVSIFVNPTQFNNKNDFKSYPRHIQTDLNLLENCRCDIVFNPEESEMYPGPDNRVFDFSPLDKVMEGNYRPGHFNGVGQIVTKLFDAVLPDRAYFGKKDYQQLAIIKKLVRDCNYKIEIIGCNTMREKDGLAMSSRNMLLNDRQKNAAPRIYRTLKQIKSKLEKHSIHEIKEWVKNEINSTGELQLEYIEIVQCDSLQPVNKYNPQFSLVACIAVYAGMVRLIDNLELF